MEKRKILGYVGLCIVFGFLGVLYYFGEIADGSPGIWSMQHFVTDDGFGWSTYALPFLAIAAGMIAVSKK